VADIDRQITTHCSVPSGCPNRRNERTRQCAVIMNFHQFIVIVMVLQNLQRPPLSEFILLFFGNINYFTVVNCIKPEHVCQLSRTAEIRSTITDSPAINSKPRSRHRLKWAYNPASALKKHPIHKFSVAGRICLTGHDQPAGPAELI
jgi:hypothetical protein